MVQGRVRKANQSRQITKLRRIDGAREEDRTTEHGCTWRAQLPEESRRRIANMIKEHFKRHIPVSGLIVLEDLMQIAVRFEKGIFSTATSQQDYLRRISLKMLTLSLNRPQNNSSHLSEIASRFRR